MVHIKERKISLLFRASLCFAEQEFEVWGDGLKPLQRSGEPWAPTLEHDQSFGLVVHHFPSRRRRRRGPSASVGPGRRATSCTRALREGSTPGT